MKRQPQAARNVATDGGLRSPRTAPLDAKLTTVSFGAAPEPHISLEQDICGRCPIGRVCASVCPAGNYRFDDHTCTMIVSTESCMECGSCRIVCTAGAVSWAWPRGGFGVCYAYG